MTPSEAPSRVSVIVMTLDRPEPLRRCLTSLAAQSLAPGSFEVIVVDASDEPVDELLAEFAGRLHITHHVGPNHGVAGNRKRASSSPAALSSRSWTTTAWQIPPWLERLTVAVEAQPRSLVGGLVENPYPANAVAVAGQVITEGVYDFFNPSGEEPRFFPGLNFAVDRERYLAIGGCDRASAGSRPRIATSSIAGGSPAAASYGVPARSSITSIGPRSGASCASTSTTAGEPGAITAFAASGGAAE